MFKNIARLTLIMFLSLFSLASTADEQGYEIISPAQPTQHPDKIEVIEFFWYGCPHCYAFEPLIEKWAKSLPKNVEFIRQPAAFNETWSKHAKAYFTAEALGVVDKVHADFFDAIQNKKQDLDTEASLAKFFVEHGVNETQFHEAYSSFIVDTKMRQAPQMGAKYGITGVPAIIINGKYKTNGTLAGSHENMIAVINKLITQESAKK
ncbi:MAG: thiol:disulfide interchange protein DsbA/DsbL [Methylococcales bacterium]|nr:MAG: thiol:disulfide interchange protein DsbA/DsbL [Methylococcales bacterium]